MITPDQHNDWVNQRDQSFDAFIKIGDKKDKTSPTVFETYSAGVKTNRDAWCYNFSKSQVTQSMKQTIGYYNDVAEFGATSSGGIDFGRFSDTRKISWSWVLRQKAEKGAKTGFNEARVVKASYRPFDSEWLYYDGMMNENRYMMPSLFPTGEELNPTICITGPAAGGDFSVLLTTRVPNLHFMSTSQCFSLRKAAVRPTKDEDLFDAADGASGNSEAITSSGMKHFQDAYPGETITKEDLFYYVYGLLHSEDYRAKYADNLSKELPRIPRVKTATDFWAFSRAGRTLGDLHVNYETVEPYPVTIKQGDLRLADVKKPEAFYRVTKWAFGKSGKDKDKTTVIYNPNITMQDVPLAAYDYVVNGKPALEWVMERQVVKTDKDSGIENDANRYAIETMNNPAYPLELFQRVITVSLRTMEIVRGLPKLEVM